MATAHRSTARGTHMCYTAQRQYFNTAARHVAHGPVSFIVYVVASSRAAHVAPCFLVRRRVHRRARRPRPSRRAPCLDRPCPHRPRSNQQLLRIETWAEAGSQARSGRRTSACRHARASRARARVGLAPVRQPRAPAQSGMPNARCGARAGGGARPAVGNW
eukprot:scaffold7011_cov112-Isochrysis_galbana.AAC.16